MRGEGREKEKGEKGEKVGKEKEEEKKRGRREGEANVSDKKTIIFSAPFNLQTDQ